MVQGRPGRPPLAAKRGQFGRLIARGVGSAEACRIVGVHPKTGKRWRRGRVVTSSSGTRLQSAAVVDTRKQVISGRFLSEDERVRIADLLGGGFGVGAIAARLGRPIDDQPGTAAQPGSWQRAVPAIRGAAAGGRAPRPARSRQAVTQSGAAGVRGWPGWRRGGARSRSARRCTASSPVTGRAI